MRTRKIGARQRSTLPIVTTMRALRMAFVAVVLTLAVVGGTVAVTAAPAEAARSKGVVTKAEFRQVKRGWTKARVHRVFDTRGRFADGHAGGYTRAYRAKNRKYIVYVGFAKDVRYPKRPARMVEKYWLRR